jgi:hypothetical protein
MQLAGDKQFICTSFVQPNTSRNTQACKTICSASASMRVCVCVCAHPFTDSLDAYCKCSLWVHNITWYYRNAAFEGITPWKQTEAM